MPFHCITSGHFSQYGNFESTDINGVEILISKQAMDFQQWKSYEDVQFPFYVAVPDIDGNRVDNIKLKGTVIYKTLGSIIDAIVEEAELNYKLPVDHGREILFKINNQCHKKEYKPKGRD
jgi:hypothetical protein